MNTLSNEILERLSQLNRRITVAAALPPRQPAIAADNDRQIAEALPGQEYPTAWGTCWAIERPLFEIAPVVQRELRSLENNPQAAPGSAAHPDLCQLAAAFPQDTMFLDLETCGFAGSMIFLAGLVRATDNGPLLTQLMARTYAEEKALLQALWQIAADHQVLVTFNGKTFDWPAVHDRSTIHHLGRDDRFGANRVAQAPADRPAAPIVAALERTHERPRLTHVDLLHHCRRRWKHALPNCRLQTLERFLCGRRRIADIPGAAIPDAYHEFVRARQPALMRSILHHNALDLVTLVQLAVRVCATAPDDGCSSL